MTTQTLLFLLGAYLVGSLPTAYILTRILTGKDIRQLGDGNVGAKNTFESVGKLAGFSVSVIDIGKGLLTVAAAKHLSMSEGVILLAGACVVLGHDFSIFLNFQGGQGMAATAGVFGGLFPMVTIGRCYFLFNSGSDQELGSELCDRTHFVSSRGLDNGPFY